MADTPRGRRKTSTTRPRVAGLRKRSPQNRGAERPTKDVREPAARPEADDTTEVPVDEQPADPASAEPESTAEDSGTASSSSTSATASQPTADSEAAPDADADVEEPSAPVEDAEQTFVVRDGVVQPEPAPEDADTARIEESEATEPATTAGPAPRWRGYLVPVLGAFTVVLAVLALWFQSNVNALEEGPAGNEALVDAAATSEVNGQVADAVTKVFSYDFADTGKTERAAQELLVGRATDEYNRLFATVREQAPRQKLVVTTTVKTSAVTRLQGNRAEVLLFVDQRAVRTDNNQSNIGAAQISVGAEKRGDQWKINRITQR